MPMVRIEHQVPDFESWKRAFDSDPAGRRRAGVRRYRVLRLREDPNLVLIDLDFDTDAEVAAFLQTMKRIWEGPGRAVMRNPTARVADLVEEKEP